jgi:hypothetical protein
MPIQSCRRTKRRTSAERAGGPMLEDERAGGRYRKEINELGKMAAPGVTVRVTNRCRRPQAARVADGFFALPTRGPHQRASLGGGTERHPY